MTSVRHQIAGCSGMQIDLMCTPQRMIANGSPIAQITAAPCTRERRSLGFLNAHPGRHALYEYSSPSTAQTPALAADGERCREWRSCR
jgi:hypothetical protein